MVTLISATTQGLYITIEENGQIGANTPGGIDLDNLTEGTEYVYMDSILRFEHHISTTTDGGESTFVGHNLHCDGIGTTASWTGQADKGNVIVIAETTNANAYLIKKFVKNNNREGRHSGAAGQKYLVRQFATTTFEQFPSEALNALNYIPVLTSGVVVVDIEGQVDRKQVSLGMWETQR